MASPPGRAVLAACAPHLRPAVLELGGNDPAIVAPDLEPTEELAARLLEAAFATSGQVCMAVKRLYVPADRLAGWRDALVAALSGTVVGDGLDDGVTMGPVHTESARDRVEDMIALAAIGAAEVVRPATVIDPGHGWRVSPALVIDPDPGTPLVSEEQFAPALPVLAYDDLDAARRRGQRHARSACAPRYGATTSTWPTASRSGWRPAPCGSTPTAWGPWTTWPPWEVGACSGLGLELGFEGMAALTRPRVLRRGAR